jgi:hypothetical protein
VPPDSQLVRTRGNERGRAVDGNERKATALVIDLAAERHTDEVLAEPADRETLVTEPLPQKGVVQRRSSWESEGRLVLGRRPRRLSGRLSLRSRTTESRLNSSLGKI